MRLLRNGAREGGLSIEWISRLDSIPHYITPPEVRAQTEKWISAFHADPSRNNQIWTAKQLAKHDGSDPRLIPHTSVMGYVVKIDPNCRVFPSWLGHNVTRRNLLQFKGKSLDTNDIRHDQPGYRPLPKICDCSEEEREYLMQNLETLLHRGSKIIAQFKPFLDDQKHT